MFRDLIRSNRSYRRFFEDIRISKETLVSLVDHARLSPSGANRQALKYYLFHTQEANDRIFPTLAWAAYLKDWHGPEKGERPAAYIVIVQDVGYKMVTDYDCGIAAQSILLGAAELGLGGCMIGNIQKEKLREAAHIPNNFEILLVIALGKPKETVIIDEMNNDGDVKYWRDEEQKHHTPKRKLEDLLLN